MAFASYIEYIINKYGVFMPVKRNILLFFFIIFSISVFDVSAQTLSPAKSEADVDKLVERGINYEQSGNFNSAIEVYRQILGINEKNTLVQIRLAKLLSWQLKLDEAVYILDTLLENYPDMSEAVFRKAQILSWQKQYEESIELYKHYLELEAGNVDGIAGLARTYFWSDDFDNALIYFNKAIESGYPNEIEIRLNIAKIYLNQHDHEAARRQIELILSQDPGNVEAKELYSTLPLFMKNEASLALKGDFFPDSVFGFKASPLFVYRLSKMWNFQAQYDFYALEGNNDSTISAGAIYKGIKKLSLGTLFSITPDPDFNEAFKITGFASYSLNRKIGTGISLETLFYKDNLNPELVDDTLFIIKPSVSYFFTDISNSTIQYISYNYSSGFTTSAVSLNVAVEYYKDNPVSLALTYGGDYESKNSDRTIFEAGGGISYKFSNNFELGFSFNHIESEYSKANQVTVVPVLRW